jgi:hypothetical protein
LAYLIQPAGDAIVQKTKNLFSYAVGKATEVNSWLNNSGDYVTQGQAKISLTKIISAKPVPAIRYGQMV